MIDVAYVIFAALFAYLVLAGRDWGLYWRNVAITAGVFCSIFAGWVVLNGGLSRPLPTDRAILRDPERSGELLWVGQAPPDVFYLLIEWPESRQPRYYTLPWSDELAAELERAMQGLAEGETIGVSPFSFDGYDVQVPGAGIFHTMPQPADPLKESPPDPAQIES